MPQPRTAYLLGERLLVVQAAESLIARGIRVVGIASPNPDVRKWSMQHDIPFCDPDNNNRVLLESVRSIKTLDYLISVTYLRMIPGEVIAAASRMAVNFHDSLLPTYAGLNATSWAIAAGETSHGVSWHRLTASADTGELILQVPINIDADETTLTLNTKCFEAATESMEALIDRLLDDSFVATPQDLTRRTYFGKNTRPIAAGWIDHRQSAQHCSSLARSLDFGDRFENPIATAKVWHNQKWWRVRSCEVRASQSDQHAGTITSVDATGITIATSTDDIRLRGLADLDGPLLQEPELREAFAVGSSLGVLTESQVGEIDLAMASAAKFDSAWVSRLSQSQPLESDSRLATAPPKAVRETDIELDILHRVVVEDAFALIAMFFARISGRPSFSLAFCYPAEATADAVVVGLFNRHFPVDIVTDAALTVRENQNRIKDSRSKANELKPSKLGPFTRDLLYRYPVLRDSQVNPPIKVVALANSDRVVVRVDENSLDESWSRWLPQLSGFVDRCLANPNQSLRDVKLLSEQEFDVLTQRNQTFREYDRDTTIDREFFRQVEQTPDAIALVTGTSSWTYRELAARVHQLETRIAQQGIVAGDRIGIATSRSLDMIATMLAVLNLGAAYVPLDLEFPLNRIELMIHDADLKCIVVDSQTVSRLPSCEVALLSTDSIDQTSSSLPRTHVSSADSLAYVIYTSGSTGIPKGVMVSHLNVLNFFAGMDDVIPHEPTNDNDGPGTWLAVTSLSFDISVLELMWTLCRGFKVVLHDTPSRIASAARHKSAAKKLNFGLFYFASGDSPGDDPYRLLLSGARFADENDFSSVWTPERHFHDFGGPYPNPAVTGAAVAAITHRVAIRSGSVVLPLHHPARVAEEWSVVDRLSGGRVGVSFASGWQPNDFVLAPQNFVNAKQVMFENVDVVRRLWRGETVSMKGPNETIVPIQTRPRPIQKELPVWITTAGNEETFRQAGESGCNILTHLLGQTTDELAAKIRAYRESRAKAGHVGRGEVTVMVHTFVGDDTGRVKELVRGPMIEYLRTSASLVRGFSHTWAAFKKRSDGTTAGELNLDSLSSEDLDDLLAFSFERYFESSGLFGTPEKCLELTDSLREAGVTEIACLIDFGVNVDDTLASLQHLNDLRVLANSDSTDSLDKVDSIAQLIDQHRVTHFQCTPSMAQMLIEDADSERAIRSIPNVLLGGEALPASLAKHLTHDSAMRLVNVYGPTETTVWSTSTVIDSNAAKSISIGRPIANTFVYILDGNGQMVPDGEVGDLWIGGDGVVPGYWRRPDLTKEKFLPDPFHLESDHRNRVARMYQTGDLARWRADGSIDFLGRSDHQVKIRGHRIELGDIETAIDLLPSVRQSIVVPVQTNASETELVAYVVASDANQVSPSNVELTKQLRSDLRQSLPAHMIPARFVTIDEFPLTPNGKVNRNALAAQALVEPKTIENIGLQPVVATAKSSETQGTIETIWQQTLQIESIGLDDNFFDLGGHSLLAVRAHRLLRERFNAPIAITDLFRFPTIRTLSAYLDSRRESKAIESPSSSQSNASTSTGQSRASRRREMLGQRRGVPNRHHQESP